MTTPDLAQNRAHTTISGCEPGACPTCRTWAGDDDPLGRVALVLSRVDSRWTTFVGALADVMVARGEVVGAAARLDVLLTPLPELNDAVERLRVAAVAILVAADYHPFDTAAAAGDS